MCIPLIHLINSKTDRFKYKAVLREADAEALPVPELADKQNECKGYKTKETSDLEQGLLGDLWTK